VSLTTSIIGSCSISKNFENNKKFILFKSECSKIGTTEEALANAEKIGFNTGLFAVHPLNKKTKLPKFDKTIDDRFKKKYWFNVKERPEIVILEGWCVGAKPQSKSLIKEPVNILERYEDEDLIWRKHVNEKLKKDYRKIFSMIDHFIFMKVPDFNVVFKWRLLQENKLRKKSHLNKKIMSYNEIKRFIMFYQRITLQMKKDLSKSASIVMSLNKNHEIKKVLFRS